MDLTAVGINIFGGGFTLGVQEAGFRVDGQWEECDAHSRTFDLNRQRFFRDVKRPIGAGEWPVFDLPSRVHMVYGNPPCAPWSAARGNSGGVLGVDDPRLKMTGQTMRAALAIAPDCFVCESVPQAATTGRAYYDEWARQFIEAGYGVTYLLTNALLHGSPSSRDRFHFIAHRRALELTEPDMSNFMPRTVRMAIGELMDDFGQLAQHRPFRRATSDAYWQMIEETEPGGKLRDVAVRRRLAGQEVRMAPFIARRLFWDAPSGTIVKVAETAHPERARYVTAREGLRLLTYPDGFLVADERYPVSATQAVMPLMGKTLAAIARRSLDNEPARRDVEAIDWRHLAKSYLQTAVINELKDGGEWPPASEALDEREARMLRTADGWELVTSSGVISTAHDMTMREAAECFGANWPRAAERLKDEADLCEEAPRSRDVAPRRASAPRGAVRAVGSGQRFRALILGGATNQEALDKVKDEFPDGRSTLSDAAWNRYELKRHADWYDEDGAKIKSSSRR